MRNKSYRANNPVSVLDKVVGADAGQPLSADNAPVAMVDNSMAAGTPREPQTGKCIVGNGSAYVDIPQFTITETDDFVIEWYWDADVNSCLLGGSAITPYIYQQSTTAIQIGFKSGVVLNMSKGSTDNGSLLYHRLTKNGSDFTLYSERVSDGVNYIDTKSLVDTYSLVFNKIGLRDVALPLVGILFDLKIQVNGTQIRFYKLDSLSTATVYDSSGNGNHGQIVNYYSGMFSEQNIKSYQNDIGYTISDGAIYYYDSEGVDLIPAGEFIPRDESNPTKCVAYLSNGVQADLQYKGLCPSKAYFKQGNCFQGDGIAEYQLGAVSTYEVQNFEIEFYLGYDTVENKYQSIFESELAFNASGISVHVTSSEALALRIYRPGSTDILTVGIESDYLGTDTKFKIKKFGTTVEFYANDSLIDTQTLSSATVGTDNTKETYIGGSVDAGLNTVQRQYALRFNELNVSGDFVQALSFWPLTESIQDATNHTAFDVVGDNHATLINGSTANEGKQDEFHYGQLGINKFSDIIDDDYSDVIPSVSIGDKISFYVKTTDTIFAIIGSGTDYALAVQSGSTAVVKTGLYEFVNIYIDGTIFTGNRGELFTLICDSQLHKIEVEFTSNITNVLLYQYGSIFTFTGTSTPIYHVNSNDKPLGSYLPEKYVVPASATDPTKDALGNPLTLTQDGKSFLNTGTKLEHVPMPRVIQADTGNVFFDEDGTPINKSFNSLTYGNL